MESMSLYEYQNDQSDVDVSDFLDHLEHLENKRYVNVAFICKQSNNPQH